MAYTRVDDEGLVIYGASGLGACPVALYYDRQGVTAEAPPEWLQTAYNQGNDNEQVILSMLHTTVPAFRVLTPDECVDIGYQMGEYDEQRGVDYSQQVRVDAPVLPGVIVRAHLDGITKLETVPDGWTRDQDTVGKLFIVEAKALGDSLWTKWKSVGINVIASYPWQVSAQMKGAGLPCLFVVGHKDKNGRVFEIDYKFVDEPPVKWIDVIKKIKDIEAEKVEECPLPLMYPCPYYPLHNPDNGKGNVVQLDDTNTDSTERMLLISLGEEYERHKIAEAHHKDLKKKAAEEVAKWFDEHRMKGGTVKAGAWQITDTVQQRTGAPDFDALPADIVIPKKPGYEVRYPTVVKINKEGKGDKT